MTQLVAGGPRGDPGEAALKQRVHRRLVFEGGEAAAALSPDAVRARLAELLREEQPLLPAQSLDRLLGELVHEVGGLGPLEPLLADPTVTEVMINGPGRAYVERRGQLEPVALGLDAASIVHLVERVVSPLGLRLDRASPMVDARLPDGSRLHAVIPPLAVDGPCVTIRRFAAQPIRLDEFGVTPVEEAFLRAMVEAGWNLLIAGATSAGKTTLLNALSRAIPAHDRIVTIEETAELRLAQRHVVRLEARPANSEGVGAVTVRDLVRAALRMRPDRLVVGEVRGAEALDMLQALNTGHDGSLSTIHANGPADALARLETLVMLADSGLPLDAVRAQVVASIDAVVFVARRVGGVRRIEAIAEVGNDTSGTHPLWEWNGTSLMPLASPRRSPRRPDAPPLYVPVRTRPVRRDGVVPC
jgi:pilus assembly protein CpaF